MKKNRILYSLLALATISILATSCVKDRGMQDYRNDDANGVVAEISRGWSGDDADLSLFTLDPTPLNEDVAIFDVDLSTSKATTDKAYTVNFIPNPTRFAQLAAAKDYTAFPSSAIVVPTSITIPAGKKIASFKVSLNKAALDLSKVYCLVLDISSVDNGAVVNTLKKTVAVAINVKNQYQATYVSNGYFYHPALPRALNNLQNKGRTVNATTTRFDLGDLGGSSFFADFDVNPTTNKVTITAAGSSPAITPFPYTTTNNGLPTATPGYTSIPGSVPSIYTNTYDPATKTFFVRYGYMGGTGWRVTEEKLVRQ